MDYTLLQKESSNPLYASEREYPSSLTYPICDSVSLRLLAPSLTVGVPDKELYFQGPFLCCESPSAHIGPFRHAIDFLVPDGTIVYASDQGRVDVVRTDSERWSPTPEYADDLNYITLIHSTVNTPIRTHHHFGPPEYHYWTQYCHLAKDSEREFGIAVGGYVKAGQPIARTGKTGWTDRDHLHFLAFTSDNGRGKFGVISLRPRFG